MINGHKLAKYTALSGVPQGSKLGPLLFIICINYFVDTIEVECLLYVDDLRI